MSAVSSTRGRNRESQESRSRPNQVQNAQPPLQDSNIACSTSGTKVKSRPSNRLNKEQRRAKVVAALDISVRAKHEFWAGIINPYTVHATPVRALIYAPATKQSFTLEPEEEVVLGGFHGVKYAFKYLQDEVIRTVVSAPRQGQPLSLNEELLLVKGLISPPDLPAHTLTRAVWKRTINVTDLPSHLWWDSVLNQPFSQTERQAKTLRWRHATFLEDFAVESYNLPSVERAKEEAQKAEATRTFPAKILHPFLRNIPICDLFILIHEKAKRPIPTRAPHSFLVALAIGLYGTAYELLSTKALPIDHIREFAQIRGNPSRAWIITQALWRANSMFVNDQDSRIYEDECHRAAAAFMSGL